MTFTILGPPVTKKNSARIVRNRKTGVPFLLQSKPHEKWVKSAVDQLLGQRREHALTVPVTMAAKVYRAKRIGDLGNYLAAVCDALEEAGIVANDRLIQSFDGSRLLHDKENPRVEIQIEPMEVG